MMTAKQETKSTVKAVVQTKQGSPDYLRLVEVEKPVPKEHEVLVHVHAATVTAGDVAMRKLPIFVFVPVQMMLGIPASNRIHGHEFAGQIEAVGKAVTKFKVGDSVFGTPKGARSGTYTEYLCLPESGVLALKPARISYEEAAAIPIGAMTALQVLKKGNIQRGQKVLVYGASGSVGSYAVQLAKHFGATVTGVCSTSNIELVKSLGADRVIDYTREDFTQSGDRYDVIFDAVGKISRSMSQKLLKRPEGYLTVQTLTSEKAEYLRELRELLETGAIKAVIDRCYTLEQTPEAHRYVETGHKKGNVVISLEPALPAR